MGFPLGCERPVQGRRLHLHRLHGSGELRREPFACSIPLGALASTVRRAPLLPIGPGVGGATRAMAVEKARQDDNPTSCWRSHGQEFVHKGCVSLRSSAIEGSLHGAVSQGEASMTPVW